MTIIIIIIIIIIIVITPAPTYNHKLCTSVRLLSLLSDLALCPQKESLFSAFHPHCGMIWPRSNGVLGEQRLKGKKDNLNVNYLNLQHVACIYTEIQSNQFSEGGKQHYMFYPKTLLDSLIHNAVQCWLYLISNISSCLLEN